MRTLILSVLFLLTVGCALMVADEQAGAAQQNKPDKVKATKSIKGQFVGFEVGDYMHAVIKKENGEQDSFFIGQSEGIPYFLVTHKDQPLEITYQVVDSYIEEAGGYQTIERIVSVKAGDMTDKQWWKQERAGSSVSKLRKKYDAMVDKARLNP
jgi:hypothetical protein